MEQTKLSVKEVAAKLVELLREGQFEAAQKKFFAQDVISIDLPDAKGNSAETKGLDAIIKRTQQFQAAVVVSVIAAGLGVAVTAFRRRPRVETAPVVETNVDAEPEAEAA